MDYRREPRVFEYLASEKWTKVYNNLGMMSLVYSKITASLYWLLAVEISWRGWCFKQNGPSCFGTPPEEPWLDPCEPVTENTLVIFIHLYPLCSPMVSYTGSDLWWSCPLKIPTLHPYLLKTRLTGVWELLIWVTCSCAHKSSLSRPLQRRLIKSGNLWHAEAAEAPLSNQSNLPEGSDFSNWTCIAKVWRRT